ncbi:hypothetical protein ACFVIL_28790 [Streptomyces sp. NPDC127159]|uniref:hypothetical protein n=1 Tax=unclassified Streptomyces TaxID=2593676 RepID=UPI0036403286
MDTHLRTRIRAGDHGAFGELFDAYARSVHSRHAGPARQGLDGPGGRRGHPGERRRGAKGQVTGAGAILERTVVDKAGERP